MQSSYWGYWLVTFGVAIIGVMISVQGITTTSTQDNLSAKEITDTSLLEAVDYAYYRDYNEIKINSEKFYEVFIRMLAEVMGGADTYEVNFYGIYEAPPKVSVEIKSNSGSNFISNGKYDTVTRHTAIIQTYAEQIEAGYPADQTCDSGGEGTAGSGSGKPNGGSGGASGSGGTGTTTPGGEEPGGSEEPEESSTCDANIDLKYDTPVYGTSLVNANNSASSLYNKQANIYETLETAISGVKPIGQMVPGVMFQIKGKSNSNDDFYAIEYDGKCGWVKGQYMAVDLKSFLPLGNDGVADLVEYNITNASSSQFTVWGKTLDGITGQQLYSSDLAQHVYLQLGYAIKLKYNILPYMKKNYPGYKLVVYDAYRPVSASNKVRDAYQKYITRAANDSYCDESVYANCYNNKVVDYTWFIANVSTTKISGNHSRGCALDVTLKKNGQIINSYSKIHELSAWSMKFVDGGRRSSFTTFNATAGFSKDVEAQNLSKIMFSASGMEDIKSEWWHYQDKGCMNTITIPVDFGGV